MGRLCFCLAFALVLSCFSVADGFRFKNKEEIDQAALVEEVEVATMADVQQALQAMAVRQQAMETEIATLRQENQELRQVMDALASEDSSLAQEESGNEHQKDVIDEEGKEDIVDDQAALMEVKKEEALSLYSEAWPFRTLHCISAGKSECLESPPGSLPNPGKYNVFKFFCGFGDHPRKVEAGSCKSEGYTCFKGNSGGAGVLAASSYKRPAPDGVCREETTLSNDLVPEKCCTDALLDAKEKCACRCDDHSKESCAKRGIPFQEEICAHAAKYAIPRKCSLGCGAMTCKCHIDAGDLQGNHTACKDKGRKFDPVDVEGKGCECKA